MTDNEITDFIENSYERLGSYGKKGRYYHTLTPDDNSPTVVHKKTNQFTYVISGKGLVRLNGITRQISSKDCIFVEAGTQHSFTALSDELVLFHIHIPDEGRDSDRYVIDGDDYDRYEAQK